MSRLVAVASVALLLPAMGAGQEPATPTEGNPTKGVRVLNARSVEEPERAAAASVDLHESDHRSLA